MKQTLLMWFYLRGYSGRPLPVWLRRFAARSEIHRAWLSGFDGNFVENGIRYGTSNPYNGVPLERRSRRAGV